jgi:outer membrane receptor for Fe3+-dicitrate
LAPGVPVHRIRAQAKIKRDRTYISLSHQQTNDWHQLRDSGSLSLLQGLDLYNLQLGTQFRWNSMNAHVSFTIQNLSDKAYMMQPFMPMPGRSYQVRIQLDYEFKKAQKN